MKRSARVDKPQRGEQEPFSRQLADARKENRRLDEDCKARVDIIERKAGIEIDAACAERDIMVTERNLAIQGLERTYRLHAAFARIAPVLRSRSFFRRLWWGLRFAAWGVFGYEIRDKSREFAEAFGGKAQA